MRDPVAARRGERRVFGRDHRAHLGQALAAKRGLARDRLVEHGAERPDVGAVVDLLRRLELLGRHVRRRAHDRRRLRESRVDPGSSPPSDVSFEIPKSSSFTDGDPSTLRVTKRFEGLRIAVHDPRGVHLGQRLACLERESRTPRRWGARPPCR